ncbi:MAG: hypothetical protein ABWK01_05740 [Infirmifilum sp.]
MGEDAKKLAEIKEYLERRLDELRREQQYIEEVLKMVNQALSSASFIRASELVAKPQPAVEAKPAPVQKEKGALLEEALVTAASTGEHLARVFVYPDTVEIVFLKEMQASTPPFESFFVRKVLEGYKRKDEDLVAKGEKSPDEVFDYEVVDENGVLKKVVIRNYGDRKAVNEIKSTLRWTLNKMLSR